MHGLLPYLPEFLLLAAAQAAAVISPGPDFIITLRQSVQRGFSASMWTALGIGTGILVHLSYVVLGVAVILRNYPFAFHVVQIAGVIYLLWLAWQCLRSQNMAAIALNDAAERQSRLAAYRLGFITNVLNPKATLFFLALYTNVVSLNTPIWVQGFYGAWMSITTALWFVLVGWIMVRPSIRNRFLAHGPAVDKVLGLLLILVAIRLLL